MKIPLAVALILVFFSFSQANADLVIGNMDVPPYFFAMKPREGLFVQKATELLDNSKVAYKIKTLPMARAYLEFAEGNINVWISFKSPRYGSHVLYSNRELFELDVSVCSYEKEKLELEDLHNKKVTVIRGHLMGNLIYYFEDKSHNITLEKVRNGEALTKMLITERAKYIIGYDQSIMYFLNQYNAETSQNVTFNCSSLKKEPVHMMLHKETPNLDSYIEKINARFPDFFTPRAQATSATQSSQLHP